MKKATILILLMTLIVLVCCAATAEEHQHTFINGTCTACGWQCDHATRLPGATTTYVSNQGGKHTPVTESQCAVCNSTVKESGTDEPCDFKTTPFRTAVCKLCEYECKHRGDVRYQSEGNGNHNSICSICNTNTTPFSTKCTLENGVCTACGWECGHAMMHAPRYIYEPSGGTGQHSYILADVCTLCNQRTSDTIIASGFKRCSFALIPGTQLYQCTVCGDICKHSVIPYQSLDDGTHIRPETECIVCKNTIPAIDKEKCTFENGVCTVCGGTCPHTAFQDGACIACGWQCDHMMTGGKYIFEPSIRAGEHTFIFAQVCAWCGQQGSIIERGLEPCSFVLVPETQQYQCTKCGDICTHKSILYKSLGNGTHIRPETECNACRNTIPATSPENCTFENGVCTVCGGTCPHPAFQDGACTACGWQCDHPTFNRGMLYFIEPSGSPGVHKSILANACTICRQRTSDSAIAITSEQCVFELVPGTQQYQCTICGDICKHENIAYQSLGNGTHIRPEGRCVVCQNIIPAIDAESCTLENGVCTACGYECPHPRMSCGSLPSQYVSQGDGTHIEKSAKFCHDCNTEITTAESIEECRFSKLHKCLNCGFVCPHSGVDYTPLNDGTHSRPAYTCATCKGDIPATDVENCTLENGVCTVCGWTCPHADYQNGQCAVCGYACPHADFQNGVCTACAWVCDHQSAGAAMTEEHLHISNNNGTHTNKTIKTCSLCKLQTEQAEDPVACDFGGIQTIESGHEIKCFVCYFVCPHDDVAYNSNDDGTHTFTCNICHKRSGNAEDCAFENGVCTTCAWPCDHQEPQGTESVPHYQYIADGKGRHTIVQSRTCSRCNLEVEEDRRDEDCQFGEHNINEHTITCDVCKFECPHSDIIYTSQDNGTHVYTCTLCKRSIAPVPCQYQDGQCTDCGYECLHPNAEKTTVNTLGDAVPDKKGYHEYPNATWHMEGTCPICNKDLGSSPLALLVYPEQCTFNNSQCTVCGWTCPHDKYENGQCTVCGYECPHAAYQNGLCTVCGYECPHPAFQDGVCTACAWVCDHQDKPGVLTVELFVHVSNGDGTHTNKAIKTCYTCKQQVERDEGTEPCQFYSLDYIVPGLSINCSVCRFECRHDDLTYSANNDGTHFFTCNVCHKRSTYAEDCTFENGCTSKKDGTHFFTCNVCHYSTEDEACTFENGVCTACDWECDHQIKPGKAVVEAFVSVSNGDGYHTNKARRTCRTCKQEVERDRGTEPCKFDHVTYIAPGSPLMCSECSFECMHDDLTCTSKKDGTHFFTCNVCHYSTEDEACTFENGVCTACAWECDHHAIPFDELVHVSNGDGTHTNKTIRTCGLCGHQSERVNGSEPCRINSKTIPGTSLTEYICVDCGFKCPHSGVDYEPLNNGTHHRPAYTCTICKWNIPATDAEQCAFDNGQCTVCGYECPHTADAAQVIEEKKDYTPNNDGTHNYVIASHQEGTCPDCGKDLTTPVVNTPVENEQCAFVNRQCSLCGYRKPIVYQDDTPAQPAQPAKPLIADPDTTGFTTVEGQTCLVVEGALVETANGLVQDPARPAVWYYVSHGYVQGVTGLVQYDKEWFYLRNGKLDTTMTAFVDYDGGTFVVAAGRLIREANGLVMDPAGSGWYYCALGQVQKQYTGLAYYDGAWFYVINGKLATGFNGVVQYDGASFRVVAGQMVEQVY